MASVKNLIIGYGNSLRSDDGVGVRVAEIVADWNLPEVRSLVLHQLTPELTAELAQVDLVIFVDAYQATDTNAVKLYSLQPSDLAKFHSHFGDPTVLLSLTKAIYGRCPQAWWVIVPGVNFQLGDRLSSIAQRGICEALVQISNWISPNLVSEKLCTKSV
ncbi:MAG: hydrogenase maturation protease [Pleurocapsa sp. MO_192.B19]|nr:hydrogenase maturation protease [Pleurocapsa sp. MO_192.B19]